jgi:aspartyl-tRNA(Asn)/glutamyl-tRNA(Gln) amidotransferase subunit A
LAPLSHAQDTIGILGTHTSVIAAVLDVLAPGLPRSLSSTARAQTEALLSGLRIGLDPAMSAGCDPEVHRALRATSDWLGRLGGEMVEARLPILEDLSAAAGLITAVEAGSVLRPYLSMTPQWVPSVVRRRVLPGLLYSGSDYVDALRLRGAYLREALTGAFGAAHLILAPVVRRTAPQMDAAAADDEAAITCMSLEVLRLNRPINLLGLPSLAFPALRTEAGHPIGLQLIGPPFSDAALLDLASRWPENTATAAALL